MKNSFKLLLVLIAYISATLFWKQYGIWSFVWGLVTLLVVGLEAIIVLVVVRSATR